MAADYFIDRGFIHFGFYSCGNLWWVGERSRYYKERIRQRGLHYHAYFDTLDKRMMIHPVWESRFEKPLKKWLDTLPKPIAIWVITDHLAVRVLEGCQNLGLRVPEDVAILGTANDTLICNLLSPPLSSIDVNSMAIGYEAARRLEMKMNGIIPDSPSINVPPLAVVTRQSTDVIAIPESDIAEALHLIREHACSGITVAKIVAEIGISRRSLERSFAKYLKRSPHDEITRIRINKAKILLQATSLPISRIAKKTGFTNRDYFITTFHREVGTTPHQFRKEMLNPSDFFPANEYGENLSIS
jgi:LacI family transcriptional regulator